MKCMFFAVALLFATTVPSFASGVSSTMSARAQLNAQSESPLIQAAVVCRYVMRAGRRVRVCR
jgi:hypothetical protein